MIKDQRIDVYIEKSADFSKEIIAHLRQLIAQAIPQVEETIKWNSPYFLYQGEIVCAIMAFKNKMTFTFWRGQELADQYQLLGDVGKSKMRSIKNIQLKDDLAADEILIAYLQEAASLVGK